MGEQKKIVKSCTLKVRGGAERDCYGKRAGKGALVQWENRNYWSKPRPNADSLERSVIGVDLYNQNITGDISKTLSSIASDADHVPCIILDARGNGNGEISPTLTGDHQNRITEELDGKRISEAGNTGSSE